MHEESFVRGKPRLADQSYALGNVRVLPCLLHLVSAKVDSFGFSAGIDEKETEMCFIFFPNIFSPSAYQSCQSYTTKNNERPKSIWLSSTPVKLMSSSLKAPLVWQTSFWLVEHQPGGDKAVKLLRNALVPEPYP